MLKPAFTPEEAFACGRGECNSVADIHILALRAMGIAAAKDVIPVWGTSDGGHVEVVYFDEEGNPVMLDTGEWLAAGPPKVYREEFTPQSEANVFDAPYYRDVTAEYVAVSDLTIAFDSEPEAGERAALAVFGNERWRPAILAEAPPTEGEAAFKGVGRGILYLPVLAAGRSVRPAGRPFRLDPRGNIQYHGEPDTTRLVTMDLTPLVRRRDIDTLDAGRLYVAYWTPSGWRRVDAEVCRSLSATDGSPIYTVSGIPAEGIYCLFNKHSGRTYHRRIFYFRKGTVRRF